MGDNASTTGKKTVLKGKLKANTENSTDPTRRELLEVYETDKNGELKLKPQVETAIEFYTTAMILSIMFIFIAITLYFVIIIIPQYKNQSESISYKRFLGGSISKKARQRMCIIS
jgi:hypothetical protein